MKQRVGFFSRDESLGPVAGSRASTNARLKRSQREKFGGSLAREWEVLRCADLLGRGPLASLKASFVSRSARPRGSHLRSRERKRDLEASLLWRDAEKARFAPSPSREKSSLETQARTASRWRSPRRRRSLLGRSRRRRDPRPRPRPRRIARRPRSPRPRCAPGCRKTTPCSSRAPRSGTPPHFWQKKFFRSTKLKKIARVALARRDARKALVVPRVSQARRELGLAAGHVAGTMDGAEMRPARGEERGRRGLSQPKNGRRRTERARSAAGAKGGASVVPPD